ncbi:hypothetical protein ACJZRD_001948 [Enterococcus hirae]
MEKQNTQELRSVSDGQKNTLDKDQSKMIDAELKIKKEQLDI